MHEPRLWMEGSLMSHPNPLDCRVGSSDPADAVDECHENECHHQHRRKKKRK